MTRQEFKSFIEQEEKAVYSFCYMLAGNKEEADELYQETMLSAVEHCRNIDSSRNPKSYLIGTAIGLYKQRRRKYARRQRLAPAGELTEELAAVLADNAPGPEEVVVKSELYRAVREEVHALPEKQRMVVWLYYTAQLSIEEIAVRLHIPKGTVKSRLHKAKAVIKERLEECGYEERH